MNQGDVWYLQAPQVNPLVQGTVAITSYLVKSSCKMSVRKIALDFCSCFRRKLVCPLGQRWTAEVERRSDLTAYDRPLKLDLAYLGRLLDCCPPGPCAVQNNHCKSTCSYGLIDPFSPSVCINLWFPLLVFGFSALLFSRLWGKGAAHTEMVCGLRPVSGAVEPYKQCVSCLQMSLGTMRFCDLPTCTCALMFSPCIKKGVLKCSQEFEKVSLIDLVAKFACIFLNQVESCFLSFLPRKYLSFAAD